ncbi:hypothetical protein HDU90_006509 [Geranomyces variabilis]|nr:hypothetical protein HDU90_006509 [Geranomyces variabilis]
MQQEVARGSISFINGKSYRYEYPDFVIRVEKRSTHVARLWFTDLTGNAIPVPADTFLVDEGGAQHNDFMGSFFITWVGNHSITQAGQVIFTTTNQKQVSVHSTCQHWEVRGPAGELLRRDGRKVTAIVAPKALVAALVDEDPEDSEEE